MVPGHLGVNGNSVLSFLDLSLSSIPSNPFNLCFPFIASPEFICSISLSLIFLQRKHWSNWLFIVRIFHSAHKTPYSAENIRVSHEQAPLGRRPGWRHAKERTQRQQVFKHIHSLFSVTPPPLHHRYQSGGQKDLAGQVGGVFPQRPAFQARVGGCRHGLSNSGLLSGLDRAIRRITVSTT